MIAPHGLRVERHPKGPRVYVLELRIHHGLAGAALVGLGVVRRDRRVAALGLALIADDIRDFPWPLQRVTR